MNSALNSGGQNPWQFPEPGPKPKPGPERTAWLDLRRLRGYQTDIEGLLDRIGPELRRNEPLELDRDFIAEEILKFIEQVTLKNPRAIVVRILLQYLHAGFRRYCRHHKAKAPRIPLLADFGLEDGLLDGDTLDDYRRYVRLVDIWVERFRKFDQAGGDEPSEEIASILVMSAILFGGLPERQHWKEVLVADEGAWLEEAGSLWFEYTFAGNFFRWSVDPVTECLWRRDRAKWNLSWPERVGKLTMSSVLAPYRQALADPKPAGAVNAIEFLERSVRASLVRHYAPDVAAIAIGRLPNTALPRHAFRRLLIAGNSDRAGNIEVFAHVRSRSRPKLRLVDNFTRDVLARCKAAVNWVPGKQRAKGVKSVSKRQEERDRYVAKAKEDIGYLRHDIRRHYESLGEDGTDSFVMAVCQFIADILATGGPIKEHLAPLTINSYVSEFLNHYPDNAIRWISTLEVDDRQNAYTATLQSLKAGSRARLEVALQLFERTLLTHFNVEDEVDWSCIPLAAPRKTVVDANLVDPATYCALLDALESAECNDEAYRRMLLALSVILYRFGPRRQDAHELTLADLRLMPGNGVVLRIPRSRLTTKKSGQAVREIGPVILPPREWSILNRFWAECAQDATGRRELRQIYLFARPGHGSQLFSEHTLFDPITHLLRSITGDETLRIHHFRHGFGSRHFVSGRTSIDTLDELPHRSAEWRKSFEDDSAWLRSYEIGHISPLGSIASYIHTACIAHYYYASHLVAKVLPLDVLSQLAGISGRSLERTLNRQKSSGEHSLPQAVDFMLKTARREWPSAATKADGVGPATTKPMVRIQLSTGDEWSRPARVVHLRFADAFAVMGEALVRRLDVSAWEVKGISSSTVRKWASITERLATCEFFDGDRKRRPMLSPALVAWGERLATVQDPDRTEIMRRLLSRCLVGMQHRGHDVRMDRAQAKELESWFNLVGDNRLRLEIVDRPEGFVMVHLTDGADQSQSTEFRTFLLGCATMWLTENDIGNRVRPYLDR